MAQGVIVWCHRMVALQVLQAKLDKLRKFQSADAQVKDLEVQMDMLRNALKCSVCSQRSKNTIIMKCQHLFCSECIKARLDVRNRKCPHCSIQFSSTDVKPIHGLDIC